MNSFDHAAIGVEMKGLTNEALVKRAIEQGYDGNIANYNFVKSSNIPTHTVGAYGGTPLTKGASQNGETLLTDGWTAGVTGLLKEGDIIKIAGVYEINPANYEIVPSARLKQFVVTADVNSDSGGNATIPISPAINDCTTSMRDTEGNLVSLAAYRNISTAVANDAAITVEGTASTTYRLDFLFHRDAITLAMVDLELPDSFKIKSVVRDNNSGLSMSMCAAPDIRNLSEITRIDAVWGTKMIYPDLAMRIWSK